MIDLFNARPEFLRALSIYADPTLKKVLWRLERATLASDEMDKLEAIGDLTDLIVLQRGIWE